MPFFVLGSLAAVAWRVADNNLHRVNDAERFIQLSKAVNTGTSYNGTTVLLESNAV